MPFKKEAQIIEVMELPEISHHEIFDEPHLLMFSEKPTELESEVSGLSDLPEEHEVFEPEETEIVVEELPGVGDLDPELEKALEVVEDESSKEDKKEDKNELKSTSKWDWGTKGTEGFVDWIKERLDDVPKHSGYDDAGLQRAVAYLEKVDGEISKAMRNDLDGKLDANKIEKIRAEIDDGVNRLHARLDKIKKKKSSKRSKKAEETAEIIKTAQKVPNIVGIVITVPLFIDKIARVCINSMVSAGHDIEEVAYDQIKKYKLNEREQAELIMHLADLGVPMRRDRGYLLNEEVDQTNGKYDHMSQWQA